MRLWTLGRLELTLVVNAILVIINNEYDYGSAVALCCRTTLQCRKIT